MSYELDLSYPLQAKNILEEKLVKFIKFEDDGFEIQKHRGLIPTGREKDRQEYLSYLTRFKFLSKKDI